MTKVLSALKEFKQFFVDDTNALSLMRLVTFMVVGSAVYFTFWGFLGEHLTYMPYIIQFDQMSLGVILAKSIQSIGENLSAIKAAQK